MKRRQFIKAAGLGVAASAVAAPAIAQSMPEIKWRMTTSWPKSLDTLFGGAEMMAKAVAEATDNKFQIQTFCRRRNRSGPSGRRCGAERHRRDAATLPRTTISARIRLSLSALRLPFGPNQRLNQGWFTLGGGEEVLNEFYKKYNCMALLAGNTGCQMGGWFRKEINTVDDLKGIKMRIGGFPGRVLQKLGARAAADRRLATSIRRSRRARSMRPNGLVPMTMKSSASTKSRRTIISRLVGRRLDAVAFFNLDKWNALPKAYQGNS